MKTKREDTELLTPFTALIIVTLLLPLLVDVFSTCIKPFSARMLGTTWTVDKYVLLAFYSFIGDGNWISDW